MEDNSKPPPPLVAVQEQIILPNIIHNSVKKVHSEPIPPLQSCPKFTTSHASIEHERTQYSVAGNANEHDVDHSSRYSVAEWASPSPTTLPAMAALTEDALYETCFLDDKASSMTSYELIEYAEALSTNAIAIPSQEQIPRQEYGFHRLGLASHKQTRHTKSIGASIKRNQIPIMRRIKQIYAKTLQTILTKGSEYRQAIYLNYRPMSIRDAFAWQIKPEQIQGFRHRSKAFPMFLVLWGMFFVAVNYMFHPSNNRFVRPLLFLLRDWLVVMYTYELAILYISLSCRMRRELGMYTYERAGRDIGLKLTFLDVLDRIFVMFCAARLDFRRLISLWTEELRGLDSDGVFLSPHIRIHQSIGALCALFLDIIYLGIATLLFLARSCIFRLLPVCLRNYTGRRGVKGNVNGQHIWAFCDTGAGQNIIASQHAREMGLPIEKRPTYLRMGNSKQVYSSGIVRYPWAFSDDPKEITTIDAYVLDNFEYRLLLGNPFLQLTQMMTKNIHRFVKGAFPPQRIWAFNLLGDTSQRLDGLLGGSVRMQGLPDIGSSRNIMDGAWAKRKGFKIRRGPEYCGTIIFPDRSTRNTIGQVHTTITLKGGKTMHIIFEVLPKCYVPVVLGEDFVFDNKLFTSYAGAMYDAKGINSTRDLLCMDYQKQSWYEIMKTKLRSKQDGGLSTLSPGGKKLGDKAELERQQSWDVKFEQGRSATEIEWQAEEKRRMAHESQQFPGWRPSGKMGLIKFRPAVCLAGGSVPTTETTSPDLVVEGFQDCVPLDVDSLPGNDPERIFS